MGKSGSVLL